MDAVAPLTLVNVPPPSVLSCHWYVKAAPVAVTENVAVEPLHTVWLVGCAVMAGTAVTTKLVVTSESAMLPSDEWALIVKVIVPAATLAVADMVNVEFVVAFPVKLIGLGEKAAVTPEGRVLVTVNVTLFAPGLPAS